MVQSGFHLPNILGPTALTSMIVRGLPLAAVDKQQFHYDTGRTAMQYESELTDHSQRRPSTDDAALFGINLKDAGQHQHCMSTLIEKR